VVRAGDGHDGMIELESYKTLAPKAGEIRLPELGRRLEVTAPYDLE
jgi:hypothetical protein